MVVNSSMVNKILWLTINGGSLNFTNHRIIEASYWPWDGFEMGTDDLINH